MPDDVLKLDNKTDYRIDEDKENNMSTPEKTNGKIMEHVEFDELLPYAGEFGIYQIYLFIISLPFYMYGAFVYFVQLFMTEVPSGHWCWIPELANLTVVERRALAIPLDENSRYGYSQCTSYVANWTEVMNTGMKPDATWKISPCGNGWEFNITEIPYPTVGTDFEWVCEKDSYQATAQSIFFAGSVLGGFIIGWIADRYGRLPATVISCLIGSIGGIASVFTTNLAEFALTRFIMVICAVVARFAVNIACNVTIQWAAEMLPTEVRASGASVVHICGYIGTIISPYIVYLETMAHWLPLAVTSVLALTGAIIALILPETARKNLPQTFVEAECLEKSKKFWEIPCLKSETAEQGVGCSN
ncbi:Carcinine transporter [Eumeta japonica]|uniref:Carcinine transporter n=1 Tax=Eumeta variegata TaxID=151549 RepID=A0A4C1T7Q7_EUMVA|nr:Carcinine transporter [Eumeta japonica]